jgi:prolipoprotein diacylglyceryltransferase
MGPRVDAWLQLHLGPLAALPGFYGMIGLGLFFAALVFRARADRAGLGSDANLALAEAFPLGVLGSALLPALFALPDVILGRGHLFENGLVSYAGYISGFAAFAWRIRVRHLNLAAMLDAIAPALGVGIALGRWGCFLAGCDYGGPTAMPWGVRFPSGSQAWRAQVAEHRIAAFQALSLPVHPTQLYEAAWGLAVVVAGTWGKVDRPGLRFARAAATYAVGRIVIELFRGDANRGFALGLSTAQWVSLAVLVLIARWRAGETAPLTHGQAA